MFDREIDCRIPKAKENPYFLKRNRIANSVMSKLNRWLMKSIIADIKELIAVANEMCSWIGKVEHLSWRFPTRSARNVNAIAIVQQHKGSAGEMYILLLEMAYDRMHFLLCLVVQFIEGYPFIEDSFNEETAVKKPGSTSLASVVRILWQRLKLIPETVTRNMIKSKHLENSIFGNRTSRGCQASGSLSSCESCSCAGKAIGHLTNIISTALEDCNLSSVIIEQREVTHADLYDKTQWTVMTKLVEAVDDDLKNLLKTTLAIRSKSEADAEECAESLQRLAAELVEQKTEKRSFEIKIKEATDQMRAVDHELQRLKDRHAELVQENHTLDGSLCEVNAKLSNLEILLAVSIRQTAEMAESKVALEAVIKGLHKEVIAERRSSTAETEKLRKSLEHLQDATVLMEKQHHEDLENVKQEYAEAVKKLQEDSRAFASTKDEKDTELETSPGKTAEILVPKGDPEVDMAQQLISNENTIDRLKGQNERLCRTLSRLKERRRISEIRTRIIGDKEDG